MEEFLHSLPEPMRLDGSILLIAIIFLVLLFILNKLLYQPLTLVLEDRQRRIDEGDIAQKSSVKTVEESLATYQARLIEARKTAQAKRNKILKESEMVREEMMNDAREKALAKVQAAVTEIEEMVSQARSELKQDAQTLSKQIVGSLLTRANA